MKKLLTIITLLTALAFFSQCTPSKNEDISSLKIETTLAKNDFEKTYITTFNILLTSIDKWYGKANSENIENYRYLINKNRASLNSMIMIGSNIVRITEISTDFSKMSTEKCNEVKDVIDSYLKKSSITPELLKKDIKQK